MENLTLIERAADELYRLKQHATAHEFRKVIDNTHEIRSNNRFECIYGLATGDCYSERAQQLLEKCAEAPFFFDNSLNGPSQELLGKHITRNFSALEVALVEEKGSIIELLEEIAEAEFPTA